MKSILLTEEELTNLLDQRLKLALEQIPDYSAPPKEEELLSRFDVARIFRISMVTVNDWANKGILKRVKVGTRVYFRKSDVDLLIQRKHNK